MVKLICINKSGTAVNNRLFVIRGDFFYFLKKVIQNEKKSKEEKRYEKDVNFISRIASSSSRM